MLYTTTIIINRRRISGHLISSAIMHLLLLLSSFFITTTTLAQEQIELGTGNYYVDLQTGTFCVRDCNPPNIENCGGIVGVNESWLQMFTTLEECCRMKLPWIDISVCAPPLDDSVSTTAASTTTTTSTSTQEELYDYNNGDGQFNQLNVDIANSNPISSTDFDPINKNNTNINCPTPDDVDCMSGLWNTLTCICDCIPPYCADSIDMACREATGCVGRPWGECIMGLTCPWWKTIISTSTASTTTTTVEEDEESVLCQSGTDIPPGVYALYASQQECELKVSSLDVNAVVLGNTSTEFEIVTLKFTVDGLSSSIPSDDMDILEKEMEYVTRWALTTLAEQLGDSLIITGIEKKKSTMIEEGGEVEVIANDGSSIGEMTMSSNVYYDITLVQLNGEKYGPIIITGLKNLYPKIMEMIAESSSRLYLVYGVELFWCYDEDGDDMIYNTYVMCSANTETVAYTIRFDNVPLISQNHTLSTSDWDALIDEVIGDYRNTLRGVDRLDIVDMKIAGVINIHPDDGDATTYTKEVKLEIVVVDRLATDFSPIIKSTLLNTKNSTLELIQSSDTSTKLNLSWCVNDNGQFTECSKRLNTDEADDKGRLILRDVTMGAVVLPVWAIIAIAVACVVVCCCSCWCLLAYLNQRDESKNERNMVTYINTGHNFSQTNTTKTKRQKTMIQKRRTRTIARHRSKQTRPIQRHDDLENGNDHRNHHHDPSFVDEDEEIAIVTPIDTLYMEQMPSFIFVNDEKDYNDIGEEDEDDGPSYSDKPDP